MTRGPGATRPNHAIESSLHASGFMRVAGLDEAGRGALAGPVVAAAVILPPAPSFQWLPRVRDSKLLKPVERSEIFLLMRESGVEIGLGLVEADAIDNINILNATKEAMNSALSVLDPPPDFLLIDALTLSGQRTRQRAIIKGDRTVLSIACASIAAKVTRDSIMLELDNKYPCYGFRRHKGYGTAEHFSQLKNHGACPSHRMTFAPVRDLSRMI